MLVIVSPLSSFLTFFVISIQHNEIMCTFVAENLKIAEYNDLFTYE